MDSSAGSPSSSAGAPPKVAGFGSFGAAICLRFRQQPTRPQPLSTARNDSRPTPNTSTQTSALPTPDEKLQTSIAAGTVIMFRRKDSLDRLFAIGIIAKGLNGLVDRASAGTPTTSVQELQQ
jgi:hypothetical protein